MAASGEALPREFDVIVLGTGLQECILAAACSRVGKRVLHLDRNGHYGGDWASFNLEGIEAWAKRVAEREKHDLDMGGVELEEGETAISTDHTATPATNTSKPPQLRLHVCKKLQEEIEEEQKAEEERKRKESEESRMEEMKSHGSDEGNVEEGAGGDEESDEKYGRIEEGIAEENLRSLEVTKEDSVEKMVVEDSEEALGKDDIMEEVPGKTEDAEGEGDSEEVLRARRRREWSEKRLREKWRNFNLDLSAKVLYCRGDLVELLISSNIARYIEFKCVTRVLTILNGRVEQVPCSRQDVFSNKDVSPLEKRMLMKFVTFILNFEREPQTFEEFREKPFMEFLKHEKLTEKLRHYIVEGLAMAGSNITTQQGLERTRRFLNSLGRFGGTPFLWPLYGAGEVPQCFCRLCAVFGGVYHLTRSAEAILIDSQNACTGVVSQKQRITCSCLIAESSYLPHTWTSQNSSSSVVSRAILITDESILPSEEPQISALNVHSGSETVSVLELCAASMVCPAGLHVVHLCQVNSSGDPAADFQPVIDKIFQPLESHSQQEVPEPAAAFASEDDERPKVLWSLMYSQASSSGDQGGSQAGPNDLPANVIVTSGPDHTLDFDSAVRQAKQLFEQHFPGEEFLPRAPEPDEIIFESDESSEPTDAFQEQGDVPQDTEQAGTQDSQGNPQASVLSAQTNVPNSQDPPQTSSQDE